MSCDVARKRLKAGLPNAKGGPRADGRGMEIKCSMNGITRKGTPIRSNTERGINKRIAGGWW